MIDRTYARAPFLEDYRNRRAGFLSGGQLRLLELERALLSDPELILIDEPTVGLDPRQIQIVRDLILDLAGDHTIILSTHILQEVTMVCDRIVIIRRGTIVEDRSLKDLTAAHEGSSLEEIFLKTVEE